MTLYSLESRSDVWVVLALDAGATATREVAFTTDEQHARDYLERLQRRKVESKEETP
jgi:hypothetical protein